MNIWKAESLRNFNRLAYKIRRGGIALACGILIFRSINEALKAGFELYDRTADGSSHG